MIGQTLSHYKILEKLGEGGMGVVYKAQDLRLDRFVALKFLPPHLTANEDNKKRFVHEAKAASTLDHPNICTFYELGEADQGQFFIAMAYYDGETVKDKIRDRPLPLNDAIEIAISIAQGLAKAHEKGITHRDIKSDNIMVTMDSGVKIMDFGLATITGGATLTKTGATVGTVPYMSPEQASGKKIDHRSDIWSLGAVIYEMITGQLPFKSEYNEAVVYSILNQEPQPVTALRSGVPMGLETIINKCLEKEAARRYQHADEILVDLRKVKESLGTASAATYVPMRTPLIKRRSFVYGIVLAVSILVGITILDPFRWQIFQTQSETMRKTLAVMYFENIQDKEDKNHLGEMITTLLITSLSQTDRLEVISRERLLELQNEIAEGSPKALSASLATRVAKRSGAVLMLVGRIIQTDPLEVTCQLVDVTSGNLVNAGTYRGFNINGLFTLVDTLSFHIMKDLKADEGSLAQIKPVAEVTTKSLEAYRAFAEAQHLQEMTYLPESIAAYKKAIELDSTFVLALASYASYANSQLISRVAGRMAIQKAWELRGNVSERERLIIEAQHASTVEENPVKSCEILEEVVRKYPHDIVANNDLGGQYARIQEIEKSLDAYSRSETIDPLNRQTWNGLAYARAALDQKSGALSAARQAILLKPVDFDVYDSQGDIFAHFGELDSAALSWQKGSELRPRTWTTQKLGCIQLLRKDYVNARENLFEYSVGLGPGRGYFGPSLILLHQGKINGARRKGLIDLADGGKQNAFLRWLLMITSYELGDWEQMLTIARDSLQNRYLEAWALAAGGKSKDASMLIEQAYNEVKVKHKGTEITYSYNLGIVAFYEGKYDLAAERFKKASDLLPPNRHALYFYGVALLKSGRTSEAIRELRLALWNYPFYHNRSSDGAFVPQGTYWAISSVKAHYWLGVAYEQQGDKQKAIKEYETFLDIWKDADFSSSELADAKVRVVKLKGRASK